MSMMPEGNDVLALQAWTTRDTWHAPVDPWVTAGAELLFAGAVVIALGASGLSGRLKPGSRNASVPSRHAAGRWSR